MSNSIELPTGPLPDSYYTEDRSGILVGVSSMFIVLETTAVALRLISRRLARTKVGWDDILIVPALVTCLAVCIASLVAIPDAGVGRHTLPVLIEDYTKIANLGKYCLLAIPVLYIIAANLPKLVILHLFLRILRDRTVRITTHILQVVLVLQTIAVVLTIVFQCHPIHFIWTAIVRKGHCINTRLFFALASIPNVITDIIMLIIPLPTVYRLQTTLQIKVGLFLTFLAGSIGLATSIVRLVGFATVNLFDDPTMHSVNLLIYCIAETGTYLIAACLPTYRPILAYIRDLEVLTTLKSKLIAGIHSHTLEEMDSKSSEQTIVEKDSNNTAYVVGEVTEIDSESRPSYIV